MNEQYFNHVIEMVRDEYHSACSLHHSYHSAHEGYAVILEELDELWDSIKEDRPDAREAIQVAATAIRFVIDICLKPELSDLDYKSVVDRNEL